MRATLAADGPGATAYAAFVTALRKRRDDLFGSRALVPPGVPGVKVVGPGHTTTEPCNTLVVGGTLAPIQPLLKERGVVKGRS